MTIGDHPAACGSRLLNVKDAARYLGTTPASLYTKIWRRELPYIKLGRSVRFDIADLNSLIEGSRVVPEQVVPVPNIRRRRT
jgi:excisionase family DNA binding protein